jgi:Pin2-interacting protein X1
LKSAYLNTLHQTNPLLSSRNKISKDPNNTKWVRDTTTFGQKILRAQGWEPGQYLGVKDAPHSELHTAANSSYIRVLLKDDNLGLGFQKAKEDEVTGLDVFQDLLGRLNGKSEQVIESEQQARWALKTSFYVQQKFGSMRFVPGGWLVGDQVQELLNKTAQLAVEESPSVEEKPSKKRKKPEDEEENILETDDAKSRKKSRKEKKERKRELKRLEESDSGSAREMHPLNLDKESNKAAKKEKKKKKRDKNTEADGSASVQESGSDEQTETSKSKRRKKDKDRVSAREEDKGGVEESRSDGKNSKKEKKKRRKDESSANQISDNDPTQSANESTPARETAASTPGGTGTSTPRSIPGSRHFVRSRFIAQKKQAVLDTAALNQVCHLTYKTVKVRLPTNRNRFSW